MIAHSRCVETYNSTSRSRAGLFVRYKGAEDSTYLEFKVRPPQRPINTPQRAYGAVPTAS